MRWSAIFLALWASQAISGETLDGDRSILEACLANATPWKEADACIDVIDAPCQAAGKNSTFEMTTCIGRERLAWEQVLDEALIELHSKAMEIDARSPVADGRVGVDASLTASQAAWIAFRKARCFYEAHPSTGGTVLLLYSSACFMRMTAERAIHLDRRVRYGD